MATVQCGRSRLWAGSAAAGASWNLGVQARSNEAADIRDRVRYCLGIGLQDVVLMLRMAVWASRIVWDGQTDWAQIKAMYRSLG